MRLLTALALSALVSGSAFATTWVPAKVSDPFSDGECHVFQAASYGSYIYQWPEKRDAVFWPRTDSYWLWACGQSGFVWFGWGDELELNEAERARIAAFLETAPPLIEAASFGHSDTDQGAVYYTFESRFERFRELTELRDLSVAERRYVMAVQAHFLHRELDDQPGAMTIREATIPLLEELIEINEQPIDTKHFLAVLGDYHFQLGRRDIAAAYVDRAAAREWTDEDGNIQTSHWFVDELIEEIRADWLAAALDEE